MSLRNKPTYFTYNLETTDLKKNESAEVCQIGVLGTNNKKNCWYILPEADFTPNAAKVNGFNISEVNEERILMLRENPVKTISLDEALKEFFHFLKVNSPEGSTVVLIAYYSIHDETFLQRICRQCDIPLEVEGRNLKFADACQPVKELRDKGDPEWQLGRKISRKDVHRHLHGDTPLNAEGSHDAMVDVQLLMEIIQHRNYPLVKLLRSTNAKNAVAVTEPTIEQGIDVPQELTKSQLFSTTKSPAGQKRQSSVSDAENTKQLCPGGKKSRFS